MAPGTDLVGGEATALRLREAVEHATFQGTSGVTVSFGVAAYRDKDSPETLLKRAGEALYGAKSSGRNREETPG